MQSSLWVLFFFLFFVTSHFAFNSTPPYVPYQSRVEYWLDSGAYHLVDVPYHHQVPNPTLRILITIYSFALLFFGIHCVQFCAVCCCAANTAASSPSAVCFFTPLSPHCPVARFNFTLLRQSIRRPGPCIAIVVEDASSFASRRSSFATSLPRRARLILTIGWSPGKRSTQKSTENNPFRTVLDRCALFFTTSHSIFLPSSSQSPVAFLHLPLFSPTGRLY